MKPNRHTALAWALAAAFPLALPAVAAAQSNEELLKELKALKDRVAELEAKAKSAEAAKPAQAQWGMTPEQSAEFARVQVKTEAIEDSYEAAGLKGLKITGFIEPTFIYNQRQDRAGFQFLNDQADGYFYDTSFMGAATIDFTKELESGTRFKLTLTPNRGVGAAIGGGIVQEATVSIPLGDQKTRLIAGQIPDWSGYEYQQPTLNPFTTHNLLYDFTLPFSYTGVGVDMMVDKWWIRSAIGNVNATMRRESEKSPALSVRVDYAKGEFSGFGGAVLIGKGPNFKYETPTNTMAFLAEVDGFFTRGDWTFQGQATYGQQDKAAITDAADGSFRDAQWWGLSGMTGYMVTPRLQALLRADYLHNTKNGGGTFTYNAADGRNGIGPEFGGERGDTERGANRYAVTIGAKYAFNANTTFKAEYRLDGADRSVFLDVKDGSYKKTNQLLGASVVVFF